MSRDAKIAVGVVGGVVVLVGGLALFGLAKFELGGHGAGKYDPSIGASASAGGSSSVPPASSAKVERPECDAYHLWFGTEGPNGISVGPLDSLPLEQRRPEALKRIAAWDEACWTVALERACEPACDVFVTDLMLESRADPLSKRAVLERRATSLRPQIERAEFYLKEIEGERARALRLVPSERKTVECHRRMSEDFRRLDALRERARADGPRLPPGAALGVIGAAGAMKSCLDCSDDRQMCAEIDPEIALTRDILAEAKKTLAADVAALAKLPAN